MDIRNYIIDKKRAIDRALDGYLPSAKTKPQAVHKVMRYAVFPGGKRIRPLLTLASFEACAGRGKSILPVASAIELIHIYTLIRDDLPCMDNDDYRRGRLSCHKKFNEPLALLAGDALLVLGFQLLSESGNAGVVEEVSKAIGSMGTIGGQVVDIERQRAKTQNYKGLGQVKEQRVELDEQSGSFFVCPTAHPEVVRRPTEGSHEILRRFAPQDEGSQDIENTPTPQLDYIVSRKTGALFEASVKVAGIFKGVGSEKINALKNFGKHLGFTFQLVDDLIDNDGYVDIYGQDYVRKMARLLTERAKAQLDVFGKRRDRLLAIADFVLERRS